MDQIDTVLVERLLEYIDPWWFFQCVPNCLDDWEPVAEFNDRRGRSYDRGRIRYFRDLAEQNQPIDHIVLDCACNHGRVYPEPLIIDGWHRWAGHVAAGVKTIKVSFSGRVDLLDYLTGKTDLAPQG